MSGKKYFVYFMGVIGSLLIFLGKGPSPQQTAVAAGGCTGIFYSVSTPLTDLGGNEYMRFGNPPGAPATPTGYSGGLYPEGSNERPPDHNNAGVSLANQIVPLDTSGAPAENGRIVMISVGMSNAASEFQAFVFNANDDPQVNPLLAVVNGAQPGQTSDDWVDPDAPTWDEIDDRLASGGLTPAQVQVAWVKNTQTGSGSFPDKAEAIQSDLAAIAQNLKIRYPRIKLAYFSSRTRAYVYWEGLSPEPLAFESGFSVKWLIEQQLSGDLDLNYDPNNGTVTAPWLAWGPYFWIDGLNPRSDGRIWEQTDLAPDCTHPSNSGEQKVAEMLMDFFKNDETSRPWFLLNGGVSTLYLPVILNSDS